MSDIYEEIRAKLVKAYAVRYLPPAERGSCAHGFDEVCSSCYSAIVDERNTTARHLTNLRETVRAEDAELQRLAADAGLPRPTDRQGYAGPHTVLSVVQVLLAKRPTCATCRHTHPVRPDMLRLDGEGEKPMRVWCTRMMPDQTGAGRGLAAPTFDRRVPDDYGCTLHESKV